MLSTRKIIRLSGSVKVVLLTLALYYVTADYSRGQNSQGIDQSWQDIYFHHDLSSRWEAGALFGSFIHFDHGLYKWYVEGEIKYKVTPWLLAEALYRQVYYKLNTDSVNWTYEQRPALRVASGFKYHNFRFRQRNRFELRMFELFDTAWRFRTDLRIKYATNLTTLALSPYVTEEGFFTERGFSRNRMYLGVTGNKGIFTPALYMMMQSDKVIEQRISRWILGVELGVRI